MQKWGLNIALMGGGVLFAVVLVWLVAPAVLPDARLQNADTVITVQYTVGHGDIFANQYGTIRPPENPHEVLSEHQLAWDTDGFRIPARVADEYQVLALGDSFTEATNVAMPWSDVLAEASGSSVRNLGFRGYGTQQYMQVMERYGADSGADVVVVGFFGANDIFSAGLQNDEFVLPALAENLGNLFQDEGEAWRVDDSDDFQYPMYVISGETPEPIAFLSGYLAWLNIEPETLKASLNYENIVRHLTEIARFADDDTCLVLAYFPPKVEVYMPYLREEDRFPLIDGHAHIVPDKAGGVLRVETDPDISFEKVLDNRRNMADVILEAGQDVGYQTLDLWAAFDEAAATGEMLYYTYDTHWNQTGHNLAGREMAQFIAENCSISD